MDDEASEDPMEELLRKHKKEKKELQAKIQSLKKSATKGDKKKKKEVQEEIALLESQMTKRHDEEVESLKKSLEDTDKDNNLTESLENVDISNEKQPPGPGGGGGGGGGMRVTKAQKRRDKKAAEQREREKRIQEQEIENRTGSRHVESEKIKSELKRLGLMTYEIEADGNCLYNAVDHQLKLLTNRQYGYKDLRLKTSNHIRANSSDYLPFLSNSTTGDMMTPDDFDEYCRDIANSTNWGGQVELRALSHVFKRPITVIQADGPALVMGEEYKDTPGNDSLVVSYHRHMYKLGEHYNSVQPYVEEEN